MAGVQQRSEGAVLHVTLCRPEKKNALDPATLTGLAEALEGAGNHRVVVLEAEGEVFCAGGDTDAMASTAASPMAAVKRLEAGVNRVARAVRACPRPVVAAVQGNAYGAGAMVAFLCDLPILAEEATFSFSFRHLGLIPDTGATWLLPRTLGLAKAQYLAWTAAPFTAAEAVSWGLAVKAVPRAQLAAHVGQLASTLALGPVESMAVSKAAFQANATAPFEEALEREVRLQAARFLSPEFKEGLAAFRGRRKPAFREG
ncbi:MAG: enoyl-CoA hydratase/isomerase family protein [Thermoplasmatota archaeon]